MKKDLREKGRKRRRKRRRGEERERGERESERAMVYSGLPWTRGNYGRQERWSLRK